MIGWAQPPEVVVAISSGLKSLFTRLRLSACGSV
jgi:hypothetical protein